VIEIALGDDARAAYAGWRAGILELGGLLPRESSPALAAELARIEASIKESYGGMSRKELASSEAARGYAEHFSRAGKAYPVLLQAEAVASKGRALSMPDPIVQAMFAAELESMILTAGHDVSSLRPPLGLGVSSGAEAMPTLGGAEKLPLPGDLVMRDSIGIIASVLLGPDARTSVTAGTERILFVAYAPPGVAEARIEIHMGRLAALASLACPGLRAGEARVLRL
jgi:hypothetical protein